MNVQGSSTPSIGFKGALDRLIGPGATPVEVWLQLLPAIAAAIAATAYAVSLPTAWTGWQLGLIAFLGFDLAGGVITNATSSAKRWYYRPGQGWKQHLTFVATHLVHVGLVALFLRNGDWLFFCVVSGYLMTAASMIVSVPLYLQRPVALGLYSLALIGDRYIAVPTVGLEWFLSVFFLKLLISHLLQETPYHPLDSHLDSASELQANKGKELDPCAITPSKH
ncbi:MAG: hypothetical protein WA885_07245 [Phormidesmis sp.]